MSGGKKKVELESRPVFFVDISWTRSCSSIDTPKGSRNKYSYREKIGLFELSGGLCSLDDLAEQRLHEIEHFFISYNDAKGKKSSRWVASAQSGRRLDRE